MIERPSFAERNQKELLRLAQDIAIPSVVGFVGKAPNKYALFLGASYNGKLNGRPVVLNLTCRNVTDKLYFSSIVNGALGVAAPRTISLSLRTSP